MSFSNVFTYMYLYDTSLLLLRSLTFIAKWRKTQDMVNPQQQNESLIVISLCIKSYPDGVQDVLGVMRLL